MKALIFIFSALAILLAGEFALNDGQLTIAFLNWAFPAEPAAGPGVGATTAP